MIKNSLTILAISIGLSSCLKDNAINPKTQFKNDTLAIRDFLNANNILATKLPSGVWYSIDSLGIGIYPSLTDSIRASYTAKLIVEGVLLNDMVVVDSAGPKSYLLSTVNAGWQAALPKITAGSTGRLYIPSALAFGQAGLYTGQPPRLAIPPNSNLLYELKLISTYSPHLATDITSIDNYLTLIADSIGSKTPVHKDASGIRYYYDAIDSLKASPTIDDIIEVVYYSGRIMGRDSTFEKSIDTTTVVLKDQVAAWKIILPKIKVGTTVTFYVPSGYGYGSTSPGPQIPANSILTYQVKLIKID